LQRAESAGKESQQSQLAVEVKQESKQIFYY